MQKAQPIFNAKFVAKTKKNLLYSEINIYQLAAKMQPIDYRGLSPSPSNTDGGNVGAGNSNNNNASEENSVGSNTEYGNREFGNAVCSNMDYGNTGGGNPGGGSGRKKVPEPLALLHIRV